VERERLFSRSGFYGFLLDSNVLLHREAAAFAAAILSDWLDSAPERRRLRVLDLACGGFPVTIAAVMERCPGVRFAYTGVDVNPDQVALAREAFEFPANVEEVRVIQGNAWDLGRLALGGPFDLVFSGMNLHHGTPGEVGYLALQIRDRLTEDGFFISHDVFRPDAAAYVPRPEVNPADPAESFRLVDPDRLAGAGVDDPAPREAPAAPEDLAWRSDYIESMRRVLLARGGDPGGVASTVSHMRERDFPISTAEFRGIFGELGFATRVRRFADERQPLAPYVACCVAARAFADR